jgi:hypothetical protein
MESPAPQCKAWVEVAKADIDWFKSQGWIPPTEKANQSFYFRLMNDKGVSTDFCGTVDRLKEIMDSGIVSIVGHIDFKEAQNIRKVRKFQKPENPYTVFEIGNRAGFELALSSLPELFVEVKE